MHMIRKPLNTGSDHRLYMSLETLVQAGATFIRGPAEESDVSNLKSTSGGTQVTETQESEELNIGEGEGQEEGQGQGQGQLQVQVEAAEGQVESEPLQTEASDTEHANGSGSRPPEIENLVNEMALYYLNV